MGVRGFGAIYQNRTLYFLLWAGHPLSSSTLTAVRGPKGGSPGTPGLPPPKGPTTAYPSTSLGVNRLPATDYWLPPPWWGLWPHWSLAERVVKNVSPGWVMIRRGIAAGRMSITSPA